MTWVGNNSICTHKITTLQNQNAHVHYALGETESGNLSEQVEHVGVSNVTIFA